MTRAKPTQRQRYGNQRKKVAAPHVPLKILRQKIGLTLEQVADRISEETGETTHRGTISAIESGTRGMSAEMVRLLALIYDIDPQYIDTAYEPRRGISAA